MFIKVAAIIIAFGITNTLWCSTEVEAHRCYVCGSGADEPFKGTTTISTVINGSNNKDESSLTFSDSEEQGIPQQLLQRKQQPLTMPCEDFDRVGVSINEFVRECPALLKGCITQTDGTSTTRTCDSIAVNDCQTANDVEYCYCSTDLCNGPVMQVMNAEKIVPAAATAIADHFDDDDEDLYESSGMEDSGDSIWTPAVVENTTNEAVNMSATNQTISPAASLHCSRIVRTILVSVSIAVWNCT